MRPWRELRSQPPAAEFELLVGVAFLLGPMVYVLTLPVAESMQCEAIAAPELVATVTECSEPTPVAEPAPVRVDTSPVEPREFMFVGHGNYVVLEQDVDPRWGRGELFEPVGNSQHRAAKLADPTKVPAALWAEGQALDLYDADGKVWTAKIERLLVVAEYGWGTEGLGLDDGDEPSPERVRRVVWNTQPHWLIGELDLSSGGAVWARDASLPPPIVLRKSHAPTPTTRARLAEFERSSIADLRKEYEAHRTGPEGDEGLEEWDTRMRLESAVIHAWIDPVGDARFVELNYGFEDYDCDNGGYDTKLNVFEAIRGDAFVSVPEYSAADAIVDVDLDGRFELLFFGYDWKRLSSETKALNLSLSIDQDYSCAC